MTVIEKLGTALGCTSYKDKKPRHLTRSATYAYPCLTLQTNLAPPRDRQATTKNHNEPPKIHQ